MKSLLLVLLLNLMDPVLLLVQLTQAYHTCVIRTALNPLDIQNVQGIIHGLTFLKHGEQNLQYH